MTIDDFDVNEISDKLAIREENEDFHTLYAGHDDNTHDDGHDDAGGCPHDDTVSGSFHGDHTCGHDDGHFDLFNHDDNFTCPPDEPCPVGSGPKS